MASKSALAALGICLLPACSQAPAKTPSSVLPLDHIRLYETGVGYFERSGRLGAGAEVNLPVPAAHVDDALKTLVVVGADGKATVSGIEFDSVVSKGMARALAGLPQNAEQAVDYRSILSSLKGAKVEVRTRKETFKGQLLDVFDAPREKPPAPKEDDDDKTKDQEPEAPPSAENDPWILVETTQGEIRRLHGSELSGIRPLDPQLAERIAAAAGTLSSRAARSLRTLRVLASSSHPITLGYIAETPVWRSSYRLVLDEKSDLGMLQGWALIHNDTDEAWHGVKIELVSGRPDSFLFPLAAPRYARRGLAEPAEQLSTVPQLVDRTPDQIWGDNIEEDATGASYGTGVGMGYGSGHGRMSPRVRMGATSVRGSITGESSELAIGNLATIAPAEGLESGALFSYKLSHGIELRAHGSTLVPFFAQRVPVRRITWFSSPTATGRSALRVSNGTRQTLPAGTIAVYERSAFAGESGLDRLKPSERTFFEFGVDLDVELTQEKAEYKDEPRRLKLDHGRLVEHFVRHHRRELAVKNRSALSRTVYLKLDVVNNSKVTGADELDYDIQSSSPLAVFKAKPRARGEHELLIEEALSRSTAIDSLTSQELERLVAADTLPDVDRARTKAALAKLREAEVTETQKQDAGAEQTTIEQDLERLRGHLKALGDKSGSPAGANPLVTRILAAEDALTAIKKKIKELDSRHSDQLDKVRAELEPLGA